ncbi:MAG: hypothetical protein OEM66_00955 [Acidimicrobiia bacterium]|nr:hypothetical protein [Acidimicrobiia bacterium]
MIEEDRPTWWDHVKAHSGTEADRRNQYRFLAWTFLWAVVFLAATLLLRNGIEAPWSWAVAIVPIVLAIGPLASYVRFLRQADELIRMIQLEALAFGFAAGVVFATGYQLLERAGAPVIATGDTVVAMMVGFLVGQLMAIRRYR